MEAWGRWVDVDVDKDADVDTDLDPNVVFQRLQKTSLLILELLILSWVCI